MARQVGFAHPGGPAVSAAERPAYVKGSAAEAKDQRRAARAASARLGVPASARLVLLVALDEWADGAGRWWVRIDTWAEAVGVPRNTLRDALDKLEAAGLLERERERTRSGRQAASGYRAGPEVRAEAAWPECGAPDSGEPSQSAAHRQARVRPTGTGQSAVHRTRPMVNGFTENEVTPNDVETHGPARAAARRPGAGGPAAGEVDREVLAMADWLAECGPLNADPATPRQLADAQDAWGEYPEFVKAHAWDCGTSAATRHPLACWLARLRDGRVEGTTPGAWHAVEGRWLGADCPEPWWPEAEAPAVPGTLRLGDDQLRVAGTPGPLDQPAPQPERRQLHADVAAAEAAYLAEAAAQAAAAMGPPGALAALTAALGLSEDAPAPPEAAEAPRAAAGGAG